MIEIELPDGTTKHIGITRLHLEQDAGKSMHDQHPTKSLIDLNRAGVALMEIVSEPDIRSPEEAGAYLRKLRQILRYLGTCDGNMEEGSMRADVNVSVRKHGEAVPHALRDQERQLRALRHAGGGGRGASGRSRFGNPAARCAGDPALRPGAGRDPLHALQGRRA
jgi:aspartyl-tRNA(Asn)/glutamyl-tRNA(Gln) amidotransferase subunit B